MFSIGKSFFPLIVFALALNFILIKDTEPAAIQKEIISYFIEPTVSVGEPVVINFTVNNTLSETLNIDLGLRRKGAFLIIVTGPEGERRDLSPLSKVQEGITSPALVTLAPGQSYNQLLVVDEWYEFSKPGEYLIEVELSNSPRTQEGNIVSVGRKFRAAVEVIARDSERLREVCDRLSRQVMGSKSYKEAAETAEVLSHIKDPVAVPYLRRLLESNKMVEGYSIVGLRRIGNSEAAEVLISIMQKRGGETATLARNALYELEAESADPSIKELIKQAMKRAP